MISTLQNKLVFNYKLVDVSDARKGKQKRYGANDNPKDYRTSLDHKQFYLLINPYAPENFLENGYPSPNEILVASKEIKLVSVKSIKKNSKSLSTCEFTFTPFTLL